MLGGDPVIKPSLACCAVLLAFVLLAQPASAAGKRDNTPPSTPTNVRVVAVTEDSITFAWNASTDNSGRIHAYIAGGIYHPGDSTTRTDSSLVPNTTRTYRVQAIDPSGNVSALSEPVTATTAPDTTAPTTPTNLRVTSTGISTVSLAWDRSSDRWSFSYDVLMDGQVLTSAPHPFTGTPSITLRKIRPGHHEFQVRARDTAGNISGLATWPRRTRWERRHHAAERTDRPHRRGLQRQLRQPDPSMDAVDRQLRRPVGDRVRAPPERVLPSHSPGGRRRSACTRRRARRPGRWWRSTAPATAQPPATP
jgi:hypothetical protein